MVRPLFSTIPDRNLLYLVLVLLVLALITAFQPTLGLVWKGAAALLVAAMMLDFFQALRIVPPKLTRRVRGSIPVGVWSPVELQLENRSGHGLSLVVHDFHPPDYGVEGLPREFKLPAGRSATLAYRILPERRGDGHFNGSDIVLRSPLRLWRRKIHLPLQETVRVFPNFREIAHFALLATDNKLSQLGVRHRRRRGEGSDFHQLREYRAGDSMRQIDWKASSRYRRLISKEYQDERDQQLVFLLDCGRHMRHMDGGGAHLDHALNAMLLLAYVAARQGDAVGFLAFGGVKRWQPPAKGGDLIRRLLDRTYDLDSTLEAADYMAAARELTSLQRRRAMVILITNSRDDDRAELSRALALLTRQHLVVVADLRETSLDETLSQPVQGFESALVFQSVVDYLSNRSLTHDSLRHQGALLLDTVPDKLPVELVNTYLDVKATGVL